MKPNLLPFIPSKLFGVPQPTQLFTGKTILITGASTGLGLEAAFKFASLDAAKVILGVRNISKGNLAVRAIEDRTKRSGVAEFWELDMKSYASIQTFAKRAEGLERLDVVVLNAGVAPKNYTIGEEGWESALQVNVVGTALLSLLLLPKLKTAVSGEELAHLIIVTSEAHRWLEPSDLPDPTKYGGSILHAVNALPDHVEQWDGLLQNARSKLFAMYITQAIAALAEDENGNPEVIVTATCPGACRSELMRDMKGDWAGKIGMGIYEGLFCKSSEEGARTYVLAVAVGLEGHGGWFRVKEIAM
jgi:NAD(P)-dependent dehydrogenase (short-subunit alcohol dehydrogenase family)